jgi:radical SAM protein with 4Fe4S-binding SPASM domain
MDYACAEGWSTVTIHCPLHTGRTYGAWPQDADVLSLLEPIFAHFLSLPQQWLVETYIPWAEYHPVIRQFQERIRFVHVGCRAGRDRLTIHPSGSISPCVCLDVPPAYVGNVRRDDLADVFHNSLLCRMMRDPRQYGICAECPHVSACGGGCRAAAYALTGRLDGQDQCCPVWRGVLAAQEAAVERVG